MLTEWKEEYRVWESVSFTYWSKVWFFTELSVTDFNVAQQQYAKTTVIEFYPKKSKNINAIK